MGNIKGKIYRLTPSGHTLFVTPLEFDTGQLSIRCRVLGGTHPSYPVGGYDIAVPFSELYVAQTVPPDSLTVEDIEW